MTNTWRRTVPLAERCPKCGSQLREQQTGHGVDQVGDVLAWQRGAVDCSAGCLLTVTDLPPHLVR